MSGDPAYRRELELELERLTKELADVRVEKAQQKQRIEQLSMEQTQLKEQLVMGSKKERRTDLAAQLQSLHSVVKQKKQEHAQVKQEWERSQEQYQQMKQTVGLLQESAQHAVLQEVEEEDDGAAAMLWGRGGNNADAMSLATDNESFAWENDGDYSTVDGDSTVITEHTKDSLQVYRQKRAQRQQQQSSGASTSSAQSGLGKFLQRGGTRNGTTTTLMDASSRASGSQHGGGRLESHLEKGSSPHHQKRSKSRDSEDVNSAAE